MLQKTTSDKILQAFSRLTDQQWLDVLIESIQKPVIDGVEFPGFPPEEFQRGSVGISGEQALQEAFNFYSEIKRYSAKLGINLQYDSRILDFGCGWGRISRFFLKDVAANNIDGVDVDPEMVNICRNLSSYGNYSVVNYLPPTEFPDDSLDIIYAYSVFSHLSEPVHLKWIEEFSRILKPGGILVATTQARYFIEFCQSLSGKTHEFFWHNMLANAFPDAKGTLEDYDKGKFIFSSTDSGPARPSSFYGEAVIPRAYIKREWTKYLVFRDFVDKREILPQALIVMQKPYSDYAEASNGKLLTDVKDADMWFDKLVWKKDRVIINDIVFRLEHYKNAEWELGENCFAFYKIKPLIDQYAKFWSGRHTSCFKNILELGMWDGGSIVFWYEFFLPEKIVGLDIQQRSDSEYLSDYKKTRGLEETIKTYWGVDQNDSERLREIIKHAFIGPLDLVIDDASHIYEFTKKSFETIFPLLRPGGLYVIEDWAWGHWQIDGSMPEGAEPTRLIFELVEVSGTSDKLIASLYIFQGFVVVERGEISASDLGEFKIEDHLHNSVNNPDNVETTIRAKNDQIYKLKIRADNLQTTLSNIYKSRGWRFLLAYYKLRDKIFIR